MSAVERDHLWWSLFLADGAPSGDDEAAALAETLGDPAEVLPYLLLKRGAFAGAGGLAAALARAAAAPAAGPATRRPPGGADLLRRRRALDALDAAMQAVVERDLADQTAAHALDDAFRKAAELAAPQGFDSHLRIQLLR